MLMDYSEDTRNYMAGSDAEPKEHLVNHRRHYAPENHPTSKEIPSDQPSDSTNLDPEVSNPTAKVPTRDLRRGSKKRAYSFQNRRNFQVNKISDFHQVQNGSWLSLHSPVRIYIPVTYKDKMSSWYPPRRNCIQCPSNFTLSLTRGENLVKVPVPAISICSRLARKPGSVNVAVVSGPKPGTKVSEGEYGVELILWKAGGHVYSCQYAFNVKGAPVHSVSSGDDGKSKQSCPKPDSPSDGTVVCDANGKDVYEEGSICQYFCYPGYVIAGSSNMDAIVTCNDRTWGLDGPVTCVATFCKHPKAPVHGVVKCQTPPKHDHKYSKFDKKHRNGTQCHFQCDEGFVPSHPESSSIVCHAPEWKGSVVPECKQKSCPALPFIRHASIQCGDHRLTSKRSFPPKTVCKYVCHSGYVIPSSQRKWRTKKCMPKLSWRPLAVPSCKRAIPPIPRLKDCKNQTLFVKGGKHIKKLKPPRFKSSMKSGKVKVKCTLNGTLTLGSYTNFCEAWDPELELKSTCKYNVIVKAEQCSPLPPAEFAAISCRFSGTKRKLSIGEICSYKCKPNYVIRTDQMHISTKKCIMPGEWNDTTVPECIPAVAPVARTNSCQDSVIFVEDLTAFDFTAPDFVSHAGSELRSNCTPEDISTYGVHNVTCLAYDPLLRVSNMCRFQLTIQNVQEVAEIEKEADKPAITDGCTNENYVAAHLSSFNFIRPQFRTASNASAIVNCIPEVFVDYGSHEITCAVTDAKLGTTTSCTFNITIMRGFGETEDDATTETVFDEHFIDCQPLIAPTKGYLNCYSENSLKACNVSCDKGYSLPSEYRELPNGILTCDGKDGLWNFHRIHNTTQLPDCLGELPTTSIAVWHSFRAAVERCDDDEVSALESAMKGYLLDMNKDMCQKVDCESSIYANCSEDLERNRLAVQITWTIQDEFDPENYEAVNDVPTVETQIEAILETTQKAVTTEDEFRQKLLKHGAELWQDSYRRGHFVLICKGDGYVVDQITNKCVECPKGTMESAGSCEKCPFRMYQLKSGQASCLNCPYNVEAFFGSDIPSNCNANEVINQLV